MVCTLRSVTFYNNILVVIAVSYRRRSFLRFLVVALEFFENFLERFGGQLRFVSFRLPVRGGRLAVLPGAASRRLES